MKKKQKQQQQRISLTRTHTHRIGQFHYLREIWKRIRQNINKNKNKTKNKPRNWIFDNDFIKQTKKNRRKQNKCNFLIKTMFNHDYRLFDDD